MVTTAPYPLFNNRTLVGHIAEMKQEGITCVPHFLHEQTRIGMLQELDSAHLHTAAPEVGAYKIKQDYQYTGDFAADSLFISVQKALQTQLNISCESALPGCLSVPLEFTDLLAHRYRPTDLGISPHRDGLKYLNIIAVFVLEGQGRFGMCDDREGTNTREVRNEPGDLLLMRAPGFCGENIQPFHFVDQIVTQRTSFALRHNRVPEAN